MGSNDKRYHVIISERAGEMLLQHTRFLAQVSTRAADKLRMDIMSIQLQRGIRMKQSREKIRVSQLIANNSYFCSLFFFMGALLARLHVLHGEIDFCL